MVALAVGGCGDSPSVDVPTTPGPAGAARTPGRAPAIPNNYAGIGARATVFAGAHRQSPQGRPRGVPLVSAVAVNPAGRVTGYVIEWNDRPPLSDYERLVSAAGVGDLPRDRSTVSLGANCVVYGSPSLKRLVGASYARVTTTAGAATASVQVTSSAGC